MPLVDTFDLIKAGQIIYLEDDEGQSWPFGVNNILNRELVACHALGRKSTPITPNALNMVTIVLPRENGAYLVKAEIEESDTVNSRIILKPRGEVSHVQRRQYFRLAKPAVDVHYRILESGAADQDLPVEGMVWDLSGSGIGMIVRSPRTVYTGFDIMLTVLLPEGGPIEVLGEVVRVVPRSIIRNEYLLGVIFKQIRENDRDRLIKYITQEQLALRKSKKT